MPKSWTRSCSICGARFEALQHQRRKCDECTGDRDRARGKKGPKLDEKTRKRAADRLVTSEENLNAIAAQFGLSLDALIREFGDEWPAIRAARKRGSWAGLSSGGSASGNYDGAARYGQERRRRPARKSGRKSNRDSPANDRKPEG